MRKAILRGAMFVAAAVCVSATGTWAIPVSIGHIRPVPYLVLPNKSDLLNLNGTINTASPYLAGVGGTDEYSGVGTLVIKSNNSGAGAFLCTGSLISPTVVLTAAHCVKGPQVGHVDSLTFVTPNGRPYFGGSPAPNPGRVQLVTGGAIAIDPVWNPSTFSGDVALVKLDKAITGTEIYQIYGGKPMGQEFTQVGTGAAGWGAVGADSKTGYPGGVLDLRKRVGNNTFEEYGVPFNQAFTNQFGISIGLGGPTQGIVMFDFDNGDPQHDPFGYMCNLLKMASLCVPQTGQPNETNAAPGDSGGPAFINGQIAAISSFGITGAILSFDGRFIYCGSPADIDPSVNVDTGSCTNSSIGEISGDTNVSYYADFIQAGVAGQLNFSPVPEPASMPLLFGGLLGIWSAKLRQKQNGTALQHACGAPLILDGRANDQR